MPDKTSKDAESGTLAHAICELKLRKAFIEPMGARTFNARLKKLQEDEHYDPEMLDTSDSYLDYINTIVYAFPASPHVCAEKRVDFSEYVPEGFGTSDCIIIGNEQLHIVDYKHGKGVPVSAEGNPQLKLYALGALNAYDLIYPIDTVTLHIVQPRISAPSSWTITKDGLVAWGESIKPIAQAAFNGEGDFVPGEHCRFCRAKALCRARSEEFTPLEDFGGKLPPLLSNDEVGGILKHAEDLQNWVDALKEYALSSCLLGDAIPGWKAVEGRAIRQFDDQTAAFSDIVSGGVDEALLYERKPLTLAAIEKALGKKQFSDLAGSHIITPPGKPTLAPESDKRDAITNKPTAEDDFGTKITEEI